MAIPDNHIDELVALALETQTAVTHRRKQALWAQVRKRAAGQTILAPYAIPPAPPAPRLDWPSRLWARTRVVLALLLTDEHRYHRAAETRRFNEGVMFCFDHFIHFYPASLMGCSAR